MIDPVLYDRTGNIRDVNTVLVPLDKLRELQADAARYRWLRENSYIELHCDSPRDPAWKPEHLDAALDKAKPPPLPLKGD